VRTVKLGLLIVALALAGCVTPPASKDYTAFRAQNPRSILVVPVLNNTTSLTAQDYFLSTVSAPFAERGYYVFPAHMVKSILEKEGLSDAGLVHSANPIRFGQLFGCDTVLLIDINKWESQYVVLSTTTTVSFRYKLVSCKDGATLWDSNQEIAYSPQASSAGNPLAALIADAIIAALEKAEPNYMPLASQANVQAAAIIGQGLPAGPYRTEYGQDLDKFPAKSLPLAASAPATVTGSASPVAATTCTHEQQVQARIAQQNGYTGGPKCSASPATTAQ